MASKKQELQREKYKKALQVAKIEYAKLPESEKGRKAWNKCMQTALKSGKTTTTSKETKKPQKTPKKTTKKNRLLDWNWED